MCVRVDVCVGVLLEYEFKCSFMLQIVVSCVLEHNGDGSK